MRDSGSDLGEEDRMWGVTNKDRITLAPTDGDHHSEPPHRILHQEHRSHSHHHSHSHSHSRVSREEDQESVQVVGGTLKKAYLLPKDHALHIPPHMALSRMEDQVESLVDTLREVRVRVRR